MQRARYWRGGEPLIYVIETWAYRSLLHKLICKLRISFTNKNIRKELKVLVSFISNQKPGGQLGLLPRSFFSQNRSIKTMRKPFSQKKICKFRFNYTSAESQNQNMHWLKNVQKLNIKKQVFFNGKYGATLKFKTNRNYFVCERGCFLINAPLFTLKLFTVLKSRVKRKSQALT